jgi:L-ribulose-5-phosphate 4-epimerase
MYREVWLAVTDTGPSDWPAAFTKTGPANPCTSIRLLHAELSATAQLREANGGAVENAVALEVVAASAYRTELLQPGAAPVDDALLERHFLRKHGPGAYYGQR